MNGKLKTFISISVIIILIIITHYIGWLNPVENFLRTIIKPGSQALYAISTNLGEESQNFSNVNELEEAYKNLNNQILEYKINEVDNKILLEENEELRRQLEFKKRNDYTMIGSSVIGKNIDPLGNTIILDKGEEDGVIIDSPVIVGNGVLVGKIVRVETRSSIVRLINDNQSRIASTVVNKDRSIGLVEGGYGISVHMNYIPQNESINVGEMVISSGLEKNIPKGLLIGTIEAVEKEAYQPFQRAILKPLVNLDKISLVSIIKIAD